MPLMRNLLGMFAVANILLFTVHYGFDLKMNILSVHNWKMV